jgi:hypothetical protein
MRVAQLILVFLLAVTTVAYPPAATEAAPPDPAPRRLGPSPYSMEPRYFPETSHYISGRIRQYWEEHGGLAAFGYPLTSIFWDLQPDNDIRRVQYFERVRIEYVQGNAQPYDILLTLIGAEITADRRDEGRSCPPRLWPALAQPSPRRPATISVASSGSGGKGMAGWRNSAIPSPKSSGSATPPMAANTRCSISSAHVSSTTRNWRGPRTRCNSANSAANG